MQHFAYDLRAVRKIDGIARHVMKNYPGESINCPSRKSINNIYERNVVSIDKADGHRHRVDDGTEIKIES